MTENDAMPGDNQKDFQINRHEAPTDHPYRIDVIQVRNSDQLFPGILHALGDLHQVGGELIEIIHFNVLRQVNKSGILSGVEAPRPGMVQMEPWYVAAIIGQLPWETPGPPEGGTP